MPTSKKNSVATLFQETLPENSRGVVPYFVVFVIYQVGEQQKKFSVR